jgi:uncharacterized membrane protein/YHS domain-containing protein
MLAHVVNIIRFFVPVSLLAGMVLALWTPVRGRKVSVYVVASLVAGLMGGVIVYLTALQQDTLIAARTSLYTIGAALAAVNIAEPVGLRSRHTVVAMAGWVAALLFTVALGAISMFGFLEAATEQALSATSVLNTELVLNLGGILAGACLVALLIPLTARMAGKAGVRVVSVFFAVACILLVIPWCSEVLLGLMRLELAEPTSIRLSFVAKVSRYSGLLPYVQIVILALLSLVFVARRTVPEFHDLPGTEKAGRRKARAVLMAQRRWFKASATAIVLVLAVLLYYDLYASRPPRISAPVRVTPDGEGLIRVKTDDVTDGNLHRYSYVREDGRVIRFFMINRSEKEKRVVAVFDACGICGDMGYIQAKHEILCIACNVRIFKPSIGREGGCNPLPLKHRIESGFVIVARDDLDAGGRYFSEVVSLDVKDPVTGKGLTNLNTPFKYEYKGRTYFFESEGSQEKFRASPETYIEKQPAGHSPGQGQQGI